MTWRTRLAWWKMANVWHRVMIPPPEPRNVGKTLCGYEPPRLVVEREAIPRLPLFRRHVCTMCVQMEKYGEFVVGWQAKPIP